MVVTEDELVRATRAFEALTSAFLRCSKILERASFELNRSIHRPDFQVHAVVLPGDTWQYTQNKIFDDKGIYTVLRTDQEWTYFADNNHTSTKNMLRGGEWVLLGRIYKKEATK